MSGNTPNVQAEALLTMKRWFDAFATGDLDSARVCMAADALIHVEGETLTGFDAFRSWYAERRGRHGPAFGYAVREMIALPGLVAATIVLRDGREEWSQVAVYRVRHGQITELWAHEAHE